jgi:DNA-binding NarL/FixJ family response regulator
MRQHIRVLIADDRPKSRDGLRALLAIWPEIEVIGEASDGHEAIHSVEVSKPDVVIMDARMPDMDGVEATRTIKRRWPNVKIVLLTLYASTRGDALDAGADEFLIKGCPPLELLAAILN